MNLMQIRLYYENRRQISTITIVILSYEQGIVFFIEVNI